MVYSYSNDKSLIYFNEKLFAGYSQNDHVWMAGVQKGVTLIYSESNIEAFLNLPKNPRL